MTDHTPGPWLPAQKANGASCRHPAIMSDEGRVANVTWMGGEAITDANARLIAAAPDLLDACMAVMSAFAAFKSEFPQIKSEAECITFCRAAIKKAFEGAPCQ